MNDTHFPALTCEPTTTPTVRDAALHRLATALALLGDDASRATRHSRDVRLHIIACQGEHLAGEVRTLTTTPVGEDNEGTPEPGGFEAATRTARQALKDPALHPLPPTLGASLHWLLLLAEAAQP